MGRIVFRELPGIASIEQRLEMDGRLMRDEIDALERDIEAKSLELFGVIERDTLYWSAPESVSRTHTIEEWESHFEFLEYHFDEEDAFWAALGLDVADIDGEQLLCMDRFGRQLICSVKGLIPDAKPYFLTGEKSDAQIKAEAESWARNLTKPKN